MELKWQLIFLAVKEPKPRLCDMGPPKMYVLDNIVSDSRCCFSPCARSQLLLLLAHGISSLQS